MKELKFYVAGVIEKDGNCELASDEETQFWTVYERQPDGTSQAICDCDGRQAAEAVAGRFNALLDELEGRDALVALQKIEIRETHGELEKAREGERQWREVVDAFCADDADWHKLTNSNNELISFLSVALCKQDDRVTELESFRTAYMEWSDKTDWMQGDKRFHVVKPLGKHRADVLKAYIEHLESRLDSANKLQDSAFRHGLQCGFSYGQTNDQSGFEQSMSAYGSREKDNG
ncbi:hypothetical protein [Klebsiella pneumoniae]|uniref:hypothetical protein n=1 Tax=Klebsiella pneumoniae TaxID=573 RepID=UPI000E2D85E7|nr:hypothetical protein [Klebsiella pneumoniae]SXZ03433.1 Uncharacterised protein [Klebsiella pneumoniae]